MCALLRLIDRTDYKFATENMKTLTAQFAFKQKKRLT